MIQYYETTTEKITWIGKVAERTTYLIASLNLMQYLAYNAQEIIRVYPFLLTATLLIIVHQAYSLTSILLRAFEKRDED